MQFGLCLRCRAFTNVEILSAFDSACRPCLDDEFENRNPLPEESHGIMDLSEVPARRDGAIGANNHPPMSQQQITTHQLH